MSVYPVFLLRTVANLYFKTLIKLVVDSLLTQPLLL
jgi:deaminated glutathione amidase